MNYFGSIDRGQSLYYQKKERNTALRREKLKKQVETSTELLNLWDLAKKYMVSHATIRTDVEYLGLNIDTTKRKKQ